jgi:protein-disulfide isomerase
MMNPIRTAAALLLVASLPIAGVASGQTVRAGDGDAAAFPTHPDSVRARADAGRAKGADDAPVLVIEISDFQCPYCAEFAAATYPRLDSAYIATGRARMLYVHLPLANHTEAFRAAEAAMCAGAQGRFWEMHDRLFAAQREWSGAADAVERFAALAVSAGVALPAYRDCMANGRTASLVVGDAMQAARAGIGGTPTFVLSAPGGQRMLSGAIPFDEIAREIDALLAAAPAGSPE